MKRLIGVLVFGMLVSSSARADQNDFRCFQSVGLKNTLRMQFVFQSDNDDVSYVIYKGGSARIPLKRLKEKELKKGPGGRPSEFETQWEEITSDGTGGTYVYVSQGALIDNFRYIRKDGKIFKFVEDLDASTDNGCAWATK
ncbi:MAG: hypothetical protein WAT23_03255 [Chromatiaceae bacterium]